MKKQPAQHLNTSAPQQAISIRLITICGSIQLISAIAAIRTWESQNGQYREPFKNIFLFYSLNQDSPETTRRFLSTLEGMARLLITVDEVWYWGEKESLPTPLTHEGEPLPSTLYPLPSTIDQLWINSTFHPEIKHLCRHYSQAKIMAYGDGPGIYFTENCPYFFPRTPNKISPSRRIKTQVKALSASFVSWCLSGTKTARKDANLTTPKPITPNEGFFLFPTIFEEPTADLPYTILKPEVFNAIFEELKPIFDFSFLDALMERFSGNKNYDSNPAPLTPEGEPKTQPTTNHELRAIGQNPTTQPLTPKGEPVPQHANNQIRQQPNTPTTQSPLTILLTANLSEAGRMEEPGELTAYENIIKEQAFPDGPILIKPHPRDGQEKIKKLKNKLERSVKHVAILDHPQSQYIPFELFIMHLKDNYFQNTNYKDSLRIITTSTACLTLAKVFGIECHIGLKEDDIQKYFKPGRIKSRLEHNARLKSAVAQILLNPIKNVLVSS